MVLELANAQSKYAQTEIWTVRETAQDEIQQFNNVTIRYFEGQEWMNVVKSQELIRAIDGNRNKISVLHGHNTFHPLNRQLSKAGRRNDLPLFFHPHGALDPLLFEGWGLKPLKKRVYSRLIEVPILNCAKTVFALTPLESEQLRKVGVTSDIKVIPNGIDLISRGPASLSLRNELGIDKTAKVVLFMGRISTKKNLSLAIQAFAQLKKQIQHSYFIIAGDETQEPGYSSSLRSLIRRLELTESVKWLGFIDEKSKASVFDAADLFVHTSVSEGMAMSILESMIQGIPVVATRGCYMFEAANAGALVETGYDPTEVSTAMFKLLQEPAFSGQLASIARSFVAENHQWDNIAKKMIGIYSL